MIEDELFFKDSCPICKGNIHKDTLNRWVCENPDCPVIYFVFNDGFVSNKITKIVYESLTHIKYNEKIIYYHNILSQNGEEGR